MPYYIVYNITRRKLHEPCKIQFSWNLNRKWNSNVLDVRHGNVFCAEYTSIQMQPKHSIISTDRTIIPRFKFDALDWTSKIHSGWFNARTRVPVGIGGFCFMFLFATPVCTRNKRNYLLFFLTSALIRRWNFFRFLKNKNKHSTKELMQIVW